MNKEVYQANKTIAKTYFRLENEKAIRKTFRSHIKQKISNTYFGLEKLKSY